jgi:hypothetical protein
MAYRRNLNRHDWWIYLCHQERARIAEIGLPPEVFATERTFREFVTAGSLEGVPVRLDSLPRDRIMLLFRFATDNFDLDTINFTALESLRIRRPTA